MPFAWTPPGRVFVGIDLERTALVDVDGVQEGGGGVGRDHLEQGVPADAEGRRSARGVAGRGARAAGRRGPGALTLTGDRGPVVVPARWRLDGTTLYAALPAETLALAEAGPEGPAALTVDQASEWRARDMVGRWCRARPSTCRRARERREAARSLATGIDPDAGALVRFAPSRLVWWHGWSSGSASVG